MMGTRARTTGPELDWFSRKTRQILCWRKGESRAIKTRFSRRLRHKMKVETRREAILSRD